MDNEHDTTKQREARLEVTLAEFRAAQQRRRTKQGIAVWNRTAARAALAEKPPTFEKLN